MSSQRRIEASRANGARSQGPVTPEGKQRSAMNAIRHGLLSQTVVLEGEDPEAFKTLLSAYIQRFRPADRVELALVEDMAAANWRQHRSWAIEAEMMNQASCKLQSPIAIKRITHGFTTLAAGPELALMHRYETRQSRMYQRALSNLLALQKERTRNEPNPDFEHGLDDVLPDDSVLTDPTPEPEPSVPEASVPEPAPPPQPAQPSGAEDDPLLLEVVRANPFDPAAALQAYLEHRRLHNSPPLRDRP